MLRSSIRCATRLQSRTVIFLPHPSPSLNRRLFLSAVQQHQRQPPHSTRNGLRVSPALHPSYFPPTGTRASFHTTPRREGLPLIPLFASILKASTAFEIARTTSRIALSLLPVILFGRNRSKRIVQHAHIHGIPISEEKKARHMKKMRHATRILQVLAIVPFALFWATIIASLEKTPLTGRWRAILLSPDEEDEIAAQLAGQGWYNAVAEILAIEGEPKFIPPSDWRYQWIQETLASLTRTIPILADERKQGENWLNADPDAPPLPPPAKYPLRPRPRAAEYLHWFCCSLTGTKANLAPRTVAPSYYSLLLVENSNASNAFSYGFGPDGASGIVVYSGFLEDIFRKMPIEYTVPEDDRSWLSKFLGISPPQPRPTPTKEQTAELAILLAHELSHLVLWHHLETLSSSNIVMPGVLSILSDVFRVLVFPVTMFFGPFVNDAVSQLGKVGSFELNKIGEYCTTAKQEIEADIVSTRILAHAGFDARDAVRFWEKRTADDVECHRAEPPLSKANQVARNIVGTAHPVSEMRVRGLRQELDRWEVERRKALEKLSRSAA